MIQQKLLSLALNLCILIPRSYWWNHFAESCMLTSARVSHPTTQEICWNTVRQSSSSQCYSKITMQRRHTNNPYAFLDLFKRLECLLNHFDLNFPRCIGVVFFFCLTSSFWGWLGRSVDFTCAERSFVSWSLLFLLTFIDWPSCCKSTDNFRFVNVSMSFNNNILGAKKIKKSFVGKGSARVPNQT